jgi:hypothetical protein
MQGDSYPREVVVSVLTDSNINRNHAIFLGYLFVKLNLIFVKEKLEEVRLPNCVLP